MIKKILESLRMTKKKEVKKAPKKELKKAPKQEAKKDTKKEVKVLAKKPAKAALKKEVEKTTVKKVAAAPKEKVVDVKKKPVLEAKENGKKAKKAEKAPEIKKESGKKESKKELAAKGKTIEETADKTSKKQKDGKEGKKVKGGKKEKGLEAEKAKGSEAAGEDDDDVIPAKSKDADEDFFGDDDAEFGDGDFGTKFEFEEEEIEKELAKPKKRDKSYEDLKDAIADEVVALAEDFPIKDIVETLRNVNFFSAKTDECLEKGCDNPATTLAYCRYHYITNWKDVKKKQTILKEGKLQEFIEDLAKKYPAKFLEAIITDLNDEKSFLGVLKEMDIDAGDDDAFEDAEDDAVEDEQDIAFETRPAKIQYTEE